MNKTILIPDIIVSEMEDAYASVYNRPEKVEAAGEIIPNPQTKQEYMDKIILRTIRKVHEAYKAEQEGDNARKTAITESKTYTSDIEVS